MIKGRIRIYLLSPNGAERHLYIVGPGNIIGESNVWVDEAFGYNASTSSTARVLRIPKSSFYDIVMSEPKLIQKVLKSLSNKQSALLLQTRLMSFSDVGERVLTILRQLASSYGKETTKGTTISIPFTHQELAYVVGSSRVSVSYVMNELCEKGIIEKQNGRYTLLT
ncbi:Crp/Fnr family transcriptional regulator [Gottfriedia sp. NPDC056225]|uniref:Crp/Fnr family transcriptional regulator n=1 Tax=Gottfriedia sp. NPDC056225 TaxID=3345751 RepID=UPI001559151B|nr:Crp/Fnr family transcriptional regulator [Arthrobacter citreus]